MTKAGRNTEDALLIVSFGGPEKPEDVLPFLENVVRGKRVPRERLLEVAEHYNHFGGKSPINDQNRALIAALETELAAHGPPLRVYWGNRNWKPFLPEAMRAMRDDGVKRAFAFVTSAFSSYSGCRQYRENIAEAANEIGSGAPVIEKLRVFYNHPSFIEAVTAKVEDALRSFEPERRADVLTVFTAHSVPLAMARGSAYVQQLEEASRLVAERAGLGAWQLAYQSRSGPPTQPWLEPDILDHLRTVHAAGGRDVLIVPIGFVSDHMEVIWDLDVEAADLARTLGIRLARAKTPGTHPAYVSMIRELVLERMGQAPARAEGRYGAPLDMCGPDCCLREPRA